MKAYKVILRNNAPYEKDIYLNIHVIAESLESVVVEIGQFNDSLKERFEKRNHPDWKTLRVVSIEESGDWVIGNVYSEGITEKWMDDIVTNAMKEVTG
jgi:hypothetical protein